MVCNRCKHVVRTEIENLGFVLLQVDLGEINIQGDLKSRDISKIETKLKEFGFELMDDLKSKTIDKIKKHLIELAQPIEERHTKILSVLLKVNFQKEYNYLSNLFSEVEGQTIEHSYISLKIEKVKELLTYGELNLSEISWRMGYSSVEHLSMQFKQITGLTPTHFRKVKFKKRIPIEYL